MRPALWRSILVGSVACAAMLAAAPAAPSSTMASAARRYTGWFLAGEVDSLYARLSPVLAAKVHGRDGLAAFRAQVKKGLGDSVTIADAGVEDLPGGVRAFRQALHGAISGADADLVWALDSLGTAQGFSIRPKEGSEAPSKYLSYESKTKLRLPFKGEWTVFWGGRTAAQNHHAGVRSQRFALDLVIFKDGSTHQGDGAKLGDYYCWGVDIVAPAAGTVVAVVDTLPDNAIGTTDAEHLAGNCVTLDHGNGEYSFMAHFRRGSIAVKPGDRVAAGDRLGSAGNSGNTTEPHLHYQLQDGPAFPDVEGMPAAFLDYLADGVPVARGEPLKGQRIRNR